MFLELNVSVELQNAIATAEKLTQRPGLVLAGVAGDVQQLLQKHFKQLNAARNKHGRDFYLKYGVDRTVIGECTDQESSVRVSQEIGHKYYGGTLRPRPGKKYLSIPLSPEAYGKNPHSGLIQNLFLVKLRGNKFLVTKDPAEKGKVIFHYLLKSSVTHRAQQEVLPSSAQILETVRKSCERTINEIK